MLWRAAVFKLLSHASSILKRNTYVSHRFISISFSGVSSAEIRTAETEPGGGRPQRPGRPERIPADPAALAAPVAAGRNGGQPDLGAAGGHCRRGANAAPRL